MDEIALHFDGPMIVGGLGYTVDEVLRAEPPAAAVTGLAGLDAIVGGVEPGAIWALDGPAGIGVTDLTLTIAGSVACSGDVLVVNGHIGSRALAQRIRDHSHGGGARGVRMASWVMLPIEGREWWSTECASADLVVLDTLDEMWRPPGVAPAPDLTLARTRLLREVARSTGTAVLVTARRTANGGAGPIGCPWLGNVLDDVADVRLSLAVDGASGNVDLRVRGRRDGATHRLTVPPRSPVCHAY